jgi:hypothetical protein
MGRGAAAGGLVIDWITMPLWAAMNSHADYPSTPEMDAERERRARHYWDAWPEIAKRLPPALVQATLLLHDARLVQVHSDPAAGELRLLVRPWQGKTEWWVFTGVEKHQWINHQIQLGGPPGFGDLGYSQIKPTATGFLMAILMSSGLELVVRASGFHFLDAQVPFRQESPNAP